MDRRARSPIPPPRERRGGAGGPPPQPPPRSEYSEREVRGYPGSFERRRPRSPSPNGAAYMDRGGGYGRARSPPGTKRRREDFDRYPGREGSPPGGYNRHMSPPQSHRGGGGGYDDRRGYTELDRRQGMGSNERGQPQQLLTSQEGGKMLSFKEYLFKQPDDPSPDESQTRYQAYLVEYHGGVVKAEFSQYKEDEWYRNTFDPRTFDAALVKRVTDAKETAQQFASDLAEKRIDPSDPNFHQGAYELAPKEPEVAILAITASDAASDGTEAVPSGPRVIPGPAPPPEPIPTPNYAPSVTWKASRVATDLALSRDLILKLDSEKGIAGNPLTTAPAAVAKAVVVPEEAAVAEAVAEPSAAVPAAMESEAAAVDESAPAAEPVAAESVAQVDPAGDTAVAEVPAVADASAAGPTDMEAENSVPAESEIVVVAESTIPAAAPESPPVVAAAAPESKAMETDCSAVDAPASSAEAMEVTAPETEQDLLNKLDLQLTYLFKVHGVDYYEGYEMNDEEWPFRLTACRLLRGPCPKVAEELETSAAKAAEEQLTSTVDSCWRKRIGNGDPLEIRCLRKTVEAAVEAWIESQLVQHNATKWGSKLSNKLFLERKYVVKHIRLKHDEPIAGVREKVYEDAYFENFKKYKEEEAERLKAEEEEAAAAAKAAAAEAAAAVAAAAAVRQSAAGFTADGAMDEAAGYEGGIAAPAPPPQGPGRGRGRGRGPRGGGMMMGRGPPMMMEGGPMGPMMMPGAMMGPMGPMFMPGAGPMGHFMQAGMNPMMASGVFPGAMPMAMPGMMRGMGGRGAPGFFGGRGGRGRGGGGRGGQGGAQAGGAREYYDLDNPANNRAVLDYGDL